MAHAKLSQLILTSQFSTIDINWETKYKTVSHLMMNGSCKTESTDINISIFDYLVKAEKPSLKKISHLMMNGSWKTESTDINISIFNYWYKLKNQVQNCQSFNDEWVKQSVSDSCWLFFDTQNTDSTFILMWGWGCTTDSIRRV